MTMSVICHLAWAWLVRPEGSFEADVRPFQVCRGEVKARARSLSLEENRQKGGRDRI